MHFEQQENNLSARQTFRMVLFTGFCIVGALKILEMFNRYHLFIQPDSSWCTKRSIIIVSQKRLEMKPLENNSRTDTWVGKNTYVVIQFPNWFAVSSTPTPSTTEYFFHSRLYTIWRIAYEMHTSQSSRMQNAFVSSAGGLGTQHSRGWMKNCLSSTSNRMNRYGLQRHINNQHVWPKEIWKLQHERNVIFILVMFVFSTPIKHNINTADGGLTTMRRWEAPIVWAAVASGMN